MKPLTMFAFLYGLAQMLDVAVLWYFVYFDNLFDRALAVPGIFFTSFWILMATVVMLRPTSLTALILTGVAQICVTLVLLPHVPNHVFLNTVISIGLLLCVITTSRRADEPAHFDGDRIWTALAPILRISVAGLYFYAVFHKLNTDYFNPEITCARHLISDMMPVSLPFLQTTTSTWIGIIGSLIVEISIITCLLAPHLRSAGLLLGLVFHGLILGLSFPHFGTLVFAMYLGFIPDSAFKKIEVALNSKPFNKFDRLLRTPNFMGIVGIVLWITVAVGPIISVLAGYDVDKNNIRGILSTPPVILGRIPWMLFIGGAAAWFVFRAGLRSSDIAISLKWKPTFRYWGPVGTFFYF